jgi:hypothetical protein
MYTRVLVSIYMCVCISATVMLSVYVCKTLTPPNDPASVTITRIIAVPVHCKISVL